jgi:2-amino-4-hydroxy-6-hydroxymethyldihydropteridine diphosphokinase
MRYYLSLGSNVGEKSENLGRARRLLERSGIRVVRSSSLYRTQPVGTSDQPWFVNQVIEIATALRPQGLLRLLKKVEKALGRRPGPVNGPRMIDLDILLAGNLVMKGKKLTIPHPRLPQRNFVLVPLEEIAPDTVHPITKKTVLDLCRASQDPAVVRKLKPHRDAPKRAGRSAGEINPKKGRTGRPDHQDEMNR